MRRVIDDLPSAVVLVASLGKTGEGYIPHPPSPQMVIDILSSIVSRVCRFETCVEEWEGWIRSACGLNVRIPE